MTLAYLTAMLPFTAAVSIAGLAAPLGRVIRVRGALNARATSGGRVQQPHVRSRFRLPLPPGRVRKAL